MATQRRWKLFACAIMLVGVVLGSVLAYGRFGVQRPEGSPMNDAHIMVDHVHVATDKPFEEVTKAFELQLGKFDADVRMAAIATEDTEEAKARWRSWVRYELCTLIADGVKEEEARTRIQKRYRNLLRIGTSYDSTTGSPSVI